MSHDCTCRAHVNLLSPSCIRHLARQQAHGPGTDSASTAGVAVWDDVIDDLVGSTMPTIAEEMTTSLGSGAMVLAVDIDDLVARDSMPTMAERMLAGIAAGDEDMIAGIEDMIAAVEAGDADPPGDGLPAAAAGEQ